MALGLAALAFPLAGLAADLKVVGLFPGKAVVSINGAPPRTVSVGQRTAEGISLVSVNGQTATFDVEGARRTLAIGQAFVAPATSGSKTVLSSDASGHFVAEGFVNGGAVRFLVDTGATQVALPATDAMRLGINYRTGDRGIVHTANGQTSAYRVKLDSVRVGDITLNSVDAVVLEGGLSIALLGMSFLNRTEMRREGQTMVLTKRF